MKTYYYTPDVIMSELIPKMSIGDNIIGLPYKTFETFHKTIRHSYPKINYLYEGKNLIIYAI